MTPKKNFERNNCYIEKCLKWHVWWLGLIQLSNMLATWESNYTKNGFLRLNSLGRGYDDVRLWWRWMVSNIIIGENQHNIVNAVQISIKFCFLSLKIWFLKRAI